MFILLLVLVQVAWPCLAMAFDVPVAKIRCHGNGIQRTSCLVPNANRKDLMKLQAELICQKVPNSCKKTNLKVKSRKVFLIVSKDCKGLFLVKKTEQCGMAEVPDSGFRIVNGRTATSCRQFPWMVRLSVGCGASIIDKKHLLTAAHCLLSPENDIHGYGHTAVPPVSVRVYMGHLIVRDGQPTDAEVDKYFIHEDWNNASFPLLANDIAIIRLKSDLKFDECRWPICLENSTDEIQSVIDGNNDCRVSGFGSSDTFPSVVLSWISMKLSNVSTCQSTFNRPDRQREIYNPGGSLCAQPNAFPGGHCLGDSGGPLICHVEDRWYQYGLVSAFWGRCGQYPGLYSSIPYYYQWIQSKINSP